MISQTQIQQIILKHSESIDKIRRKDIHESTKEEHQFKSIDCILFPELYHVGFQPFPRYDLKLDKNRIVSIVQAPKELQLAMGYLQNDVELQAHYILNKYYERNQNVDILDITSDSIGIVNQKSNVANSRDDEDNDIPILDLKTSGVQFHNLDDLKQILVGDMNISSLEQNRKMILLMDDLKSRMNDHKCRYRYATTRSKTDDIEFANIQELIHHHASENVGNNYYNRPFADCNPFILIGDNVEIMQTMSSQMKSEESRCHHFIIKEDEDDRRKPASLTICIVFHGEFINEEYNPASLSASLRMMNNNGILTSSLGTAPYELQIINTNKKLGRIIIKYDYEKDHEASYTKFKLEICAMSTCHYSIDVSCNVLYHAHDFVVDMHWHYLHNKCRIKQLEQNLIDEALDCRIAAIKISLLQELVQSAETIRAQYEKDIQQLESDASSKNFKIIIEEIKVCISVFSLHSTVLWFCNDAHRKDTVTLPYQESGSRICQAMSLDLYPASSNS